MLFTKLQKNFRGFHCGPGPGLEKEAVRSLVSDVSCILLLIKPQEQILGELLALHPATVGSLQLKLGVEQGGQHLQGGGDKRIGRKSSRRSEQEK